MQPHRHVVQQLLSTTWTPKCVQLSKVLLCLQVLKRFGTRASVTVLVRTSKFASRLDTSLLAGT